MKKNLKWLIPVVALVVLAAVVAVVLTMCGGPVQNTTPTTEPVAQESSGIYWNVDKERYSTGEFIRNPRDGYYTLRMAMDGQQMDIRVADKVLADFADTLEVMGFVFDENGIATEVVRLEDFTGGIVAEDYYVESFTDTEVVCNSLGTGGGFSLTLTISEDTAIYRVGGTGPLVGMPGKLQVGGKILAVRDLEGNITHIFAEPPFEMADVYWNVQRMYNSSTKSTTRQSDLIGRYTYTFAVNGEQVELMTKDSAVANRIDSIAAKCMGLVFDEEGYIVEVTTTKEATGGSSFGSWYHVMGIEGNIVSATKYSSGSDIGTSIRGTMAEDCKVYDVSKNAEYVGVPAELKLYDQIHGLKNEHGEICVIFIISHTYESEIYWNVSRQWDSTNKVTKRTPDGNGWYNIKLAVNGEQVTLKTKDKAICNSIDSIGVKCFGLKVEGDEILEVYTHTSVWGGRQFCSWDVVTDITDGVVTAKEADTKKTPAEYVGPMAEDCKVYNVSTNAGMVGELTTLKEGDKIHALKDLEGNITHVFVVERPVYATIYWNVSRQWDSTNKVTKRTPNAEGYYEFVLATGGKQVTLKTKSKSIANSIDGNAVKCFGLYTSGDVITRYFTAGNVVGGAQFCSWDNVTAISGRTVTAKEADASKGNKTYRDYMTSSCGVYDVSGNGLFVGEKTTLQVGDKIHALKYSDGGSTHIFVVERSLESDIYWNVSRQWDSTAGATKRTPNAEGFYEIVLAVNGEQKTFRTNDIAIVNEIDGTAVRCFGLRVNEDIIEKVYKHTSVEGGKQFCSWDYVTEIGEDGTVIATEEGDETKTYTGKLTEDTKVYNVSANHESFAGEATELKLGDKIHGMKDDEGNLTTVYVVEREKEKEHKTAVCAVCGGEAVEWTSWDGVAPLETGHYYLTEAVQVSATAYIGSASDSTPVVCFDLCGNSIAASVRVFRVYGTLNLMDSAETDGTITSSVTGQAPGFYVYDAGIFNMYGGTFATAGQQNSESGLGALGLKADSNATFNLYGGTLEGGSTKKGGGALDLYHSSVFNMYGGTINGGATLTSGGTIAMAPESEINLYGGTITAGTVEGTCNCVYGLGTVNLYGQNKLVVEEIYLPAGKLIAISGTLATDSSVGILLAEGVGEFATTDVEANKTFFHCGDEEINFEAGKLSVGKKPVVKVYCEHCKEDVEWNVWDGGNNLTGGHYYLGGDTVVSNTVYIGSATDSAPVVCLDLRGNDITATKRVFRVYGTLNLMDSAETDGTITSSVTGQAPGFYVYDAGTFNMYGGTFATTGQQNSESGLGALGLKANSNATFNLYGGTLEGGSTKKGGGALDMYHSSVFNMYGGTVNGGATLTSGGTISMAEESVVNIYGGTITMGQATVAGNCVNGNGTITLYGTENKITIAQIRLPSGKTLAISGTLAAESSVGILMENGTGAFTGTTVEANRVAFDGGEMDVVFEEDVLKLQEPEKPHTHCVCGGVGEKGDHTACTPVVWQPWPGVDSWESDAYYFLTADITLDGMLEIASGKTLNLCLSGKNIIGADRVFHIDGTLNLCDCAETDGVVSTTRVRQAPVFYVRDGAVFNLYGGTLQGTNKVSSDGGVGAIGLSANGGAKMNIYGGTITGGSTTKNGGNLILYHNSVLKMYGGTISAGAADTEGGNIYIGNSAAVVEISGGVITGGTANHGGNISVRGKLTVSGSGLVCGGKAAARGGNIYILNTGDCTIDGATVSGNDASGNPVTGGNAAYGGNICIRSDASTAKLTLKDATITAGVSSDSAGGIYSRGTSLVTVSGKVNITGNQTTKSGKSDHNLFLINGALLTIGTDGLHEQARIGVNMNTPATGVFLTCADEAQAAKLIADGVITADDTGKTITHSGAEVSLVTAG